jgi:predicted DNA-binding transcriptional regulator AlpA
VGSSYEASEKLGCSNANDIAKMLGVSKQRVSQLSRHWSFPRPVDVVSGRRVWMTSDIEVWQVDREKESLMTKQRPEWREILTEVMIAADEAEEAEGKFYRLVLAANARGIPWSVIGREFDLSGRQCYERFTRSDSRLRRKYGGA